MPVKRSSLSTHLIRLPGVGGYVRNLHDPLLDVKFRLYRDYLKNPSSRVLFERQNPDLSETQQAVVASLKNEGMSFVDIGDLLGSRDDWRAVSVYAKTFAESDVVKDKIRSFEEEAEPAHAKDHRSLVRHFVEDQVLEWDNPFLQLGLNTRILDVVNSYLGMWSKLKKIHLWYNIPLNIARTRTGAQNWHRDPEDQKMLTVFLYFTDVDQDSGPLQYIPETRFEGRYSSRWPKYGGATRISSVTDQEIENEIPASDIKTCLCRRGTLLFCDTSGFHRGGYATTRERLVAHWTYASAASLWPRRFKINEDVRYLNFSSQSKYALK